MDVFKVVKFESNNIADDACKKLFTLRKFPQGNNKKKKKSVQSGRIEKNNKSKKNVQKAKKITVLVNNTANKFRTSVQPNLEKKSKIKKKKERQEQPVKNSLDNASKPAKHKVKTLEDNRTDTKKPKKKKSKKPEEKIQDVINEETPKLTYKQKKILKLKQKLKETVAVDTKPKKLPEMSLRSRMMARLQSARFRYINEQIYSNDSKEAKKMFSQDPEAFKAYHDGYKQQVNKWPLNPLDVIINSIQKMPKTHVIADMGCGEANLTQSVTQKVHSFDLVAANDLVKACDMARVPLPNGSVDVVVFCLSLMGTNLRDYLSEANRILKQGGLLKIAEVESRFDDVNVFIDGLKRFHFKNVWTDLSHNLFYFLDFKKELNIKNKNKLPTLSLHPCLYKKR